MKGTIWLPTRTKLYNEMICYFALTGYILNTYLVCKWYLKGKYLGLQNLSGQCHCFVFLRLQVHPRLHKKGH